MVGDKKAAGEVANKIRAKLELAGESLAYVRDQLGHHSIKLTVDIYGHLAPEGNKQAVDRLDDVSPMNPSAPYMYPGHSEEEKRLATVG